MNQTVITGCAFLILISYQYGYGDSDETVNKTEAETQINLQSLTSLQLNHQYLSKNLDQSLLLMRDEKLQEENISITSDKDRWEVILSKTHPYKAKFQYDRVKNKQKSRLIE